MEYKELMEFIDKSQRCQRNWDLSKEIPKEDLDLILYAATKSPSKQNLSFFDLHVVKDRKIIEDIYQETDTTSLKRKNPQVLANVLLVYVKKHRITSTQSVYPYSFFTEGDYHDEKVRSKINRDTNLSTGISAGYACLVANMIGYETGFCKCYNMSTINLILKLKRDTEISLMLGIGYGDKNKNRRENHVTGEMIQTFDKDPEIKVIHHGD